MVIKIQYYNEDKYYLAYDLPAFEQLTNKKRLMVSSSKEDAAQVSQAYREQGFLLWTFCGWAVKWGTQGLKIFRWKLQ